MSLSMLLVLNEYRSRTTSPLWATQTARIGIQQTRQGLLLPLCVMQAALSHLYRDLSPLRVTVLASSAPLHLPCIIPGGRMLLRCAVHRRHVVPDAPPLSVTRPHAHRIAHDAPEDAVVDEAVICAGLVILACMMQEVAASAVFPARCRPAYGVSHADAVLHAAVKYPC